MQHLTVVTTGGTIDKIYFDAKSEYEVGAPQIGDILTQLGVAFEFDVVPILRKDSLEITDADRDWSYRAPRTLEVPGEACN